MTLLSPIHGKLDAAARSSRKSGSRMVGRLEPFTWLQVQLARGRSLDRLIQAAVRRTWPGLRRDLDRLAAGAYLLELFSNCVPFRGEEGGEGPPAPVFALLVECLDVLQDDDSPDRLCRWAEVHLLDRLGYSPRLEGCTGCGAEVSAGVRAWFSPASGGLRCPACGRGARGCPLSPPALASLRHLRRIPATALRRLRLDPGPSRELEEALHAHFQEHWPQSLRSLGVLRRLAAPEPR